MNPAGFMICTMNFIKVSVQGYTLFTDTALKPFGAMVILGKYMLVMTSSQGLNCSSLELNIRGSCSCFLVSHFLNPNECLLNTVTGKNGLFAQAFKRSVL